MKRFRAIRYFFKLAMPKRESLFDLDPDEFGAEYYEDIHGDFYPDLNEEYIESQREQRNIFFGRNINWVGTRGEMVRVPVEMMYPIEGNQFDPVKMKALQEKIQWSEDKVYLYAPTVSVSMVTPQTIREYAANGTELTTGDEEMDQYLEDFESWAEENLSYDLLTSDYIDSSDPDEIVNAKDRLEELRESESELDEFDKDELSHLEGVLSEIEKVIGMEKRIDDLKDNPAGDVGELIYQIRDGNHRAFAAKNVGEEYIWCFVYENQLNEIKENPERYSEQGIELY